LPPEGKMARGSGVDGGQQTAEYVSRPTLWNLLGKDVFLYAVVSSTVVIWAVYFAIFGMLNDEITTDSGLTGSQMFVIFLLMTLGDIGILGWRVRTLSTFVNHGVEATGRVVGITTVGDQVGVDYEHDFQGSNLKGSIGLGGFATHKTAERFIGREIILLVNPEKPKRTLVLTKLKRD
jgi:hypothetical protein